MKNIFSSRRNKNPHNNEEAEKSEAPFFSKESKTPFFNNKSATIQTKLTIGQPNDKYEKEADTMADAVVNNSSKPDIQNKEISSIQRESLATPQEDEKLGTAEQRMEEDKLVQEKPEIQRMEEPKEEEMVSKMDAPAEEKEGMINKMDEEEEKPVQTKSDGKSSTASQGLSQQIKSKSGKGKGLSKNAQAEMESSFKTDFSDVNIHTDNDAVHMNKELGAQAFTHGKDVYFNSGKYNPDSTEGKRLLAHELTHVVQQNSKKKIQKQDGVVKAKPKSKIKYSRAKKRNQKLSKERHLGWGIQLELIGGGKFKNWAVLWKEKKWNDFADAVAKYQSEIGFKKKNKNGILNLQTWATITGLGGTMAGIEKVKGKAENVCTLASDQRIKKAHKILGKKFKLPKGKTKSEYNSILQSMPKKMRHVDKKYRGTGAAGAMVYAGLGTFVSEGDIWKGKLTPGAALQVWGYKNAFDFLRAGKNFRYKKVRKEFSKLDFYGTSMIFVSYVGGDFSKLRVRHFSGTEEKTISNYDKWIAANIN